MKRLMLLIALVIGAKYFLCSQRDCVRQTATCAWAVTREAPPGPRVEREPADGLPVPIVPGTRVERAEILPPRVVKPFTAPTAAPMGTETRPVVGRLSATEERARHDARLILDREVSEWLTPDIPRAWKAPAHLVDAMIEGVEIKPIDKDYGTLYEATQRVNFSPARRAAIVEVYQRELVLRRLAVLGGGLAFVLSCLTAIAGYIKADETTKGYYTNRLRLAAAAVVGAAGVLIYKTLA